MDLPKLTALVTALIGLSIAAQRLVDILKNIFPVFSTQNTDPDKEGWRRAGVQLMAVGAGIGTALLAKSSNLLSTDLPVQNPVLLGLLASAGSEFWTSILGYAKGIKEIKTAEALDTKVKVAANNAATAAVAAMPVGVMAVADDAPTGAPTAAQLHAQKAQAALNDIITIANNKLKRSL